MSYRFMRVLVFFDLPNVTSAEKRNYRKFRKFLIESGFIMLQESVYAKLALNQTAAAAVMQSVRKNKPESGLVQMLLITEKQFAKMEFVVGEYSSEILSSDERLVIV
ncbi:MAG: CRISPR-associated endonuclease Cas2 [Clostridia bacterium]|nr:CRISPR-associated endonuclease Cas2 [Clostridia bacterium]